MNETMHQITKAICEEFMRQSREDRVNSGYASPLPTGRHEMVLDGVFDLALVASAGLKALHDAAPMSIEVADWWGREVGAL